jgi:hypothetical protein
MRFKDITEDGQRKPQAKRDEVLRQAKAAGFDVTEKGGPTPEQIVAAADEKPVEIFHDTDEATDADFLRFVFGDEQRKKS